MNACEAIFACVIVLLQFPLLAASFQRSHRRIGERALIQTSQVLWKTGNTTHSKIHETALVTGDTDRDKSGDTDQDKASLRPYGRSGGLLCGLLLVVVGIPACVLHLQSEKTSARSIPHEEPPNLGRRNSGSQLSDDWTRSYSQTDIGSKNNTSVFSPFWRSVLLLVKTTIGAGVLTLPFAFSQAGWLMGSCLTVLVAILMLGTIHVLSATTERTGAINYGEMIRLALGKRWQVFVEICIILSQLVVCAACLVIIGDSFTPTSRSVLHHLSISDEFRTSWQVAVLVIGSTIALPLASFFRHIARLDALALFGVVMIVCIAGSVVQHYIQWDGTPPPGGPVRMSGSPHNIGAVIPIIVFAYNCHAQTPRIYREFRQVEKQAGWSSVTFCACSITTSIYIAVGVMGYMLFGNGVKPDVITEPLFKKESPFLNFLVGSQAVIAYLLNHFPLREALYDLLCMAGCMHRVHAPEHTRLTSFDQSTKTFRENDGAIPVARSVVLAVIIFATTAGLSLYMQNLRVFAPLLGTIGSMVCFVCPAACLWHLYPRSTWHRSGAVVFALCGLFVLGAYIWLPLAHAAHTQPRVFF